MKILADRPVEPHPHPPRPARHCSSSVLLPLILIVVLGITYGAGSRARSASWTPTAVRWRATSSRAIERAPGSPIEIRRYASLDALRDAAARGFVAGRHAHPRRTTTTRLAAARAAIRHRRDAAHDQRRAPSGPCVDRAIAAQAALVRAARFVAAPDGVPFDAALEPPAPSAARRPGSP